MPTQTPADGMVAMTKNTATPPQTPGASPQKQALLDAFDTVLKTQAEEREAEHREAELARKHKGVGPSVAVFALLVLGLCGYLYMDRPEWLFPSAAVPESTAVQEASLRIGMANVAQHIEQYRKRTGRLPATLAEAGTQLDGVSYQAIDTTWHLTGTHGGLELTLTSQQPVAAFVGRSYDLISRRRP